MRVNSRSMAVASISALALFATACGGGGDDEGGSGGAGGEMTVGGCNPENPLVAGNTSETCGGDVLNILTAKLVKYDPETAEPTNDIAESIETDDNQNFTIKIKEGYKFHDGTDVTADSFVDAWNYTAYGPNAQGGSYFMAPIEGFKEVNAEKSKTKELSGLKVKDDTTFTVKTSEPVVDFPVRLGYTAFAPQPEAFFEDPEGFGDEPIAAGPYKFDSWDKNKTIKLSKFEDYSGEFEGNADAITFQIFQDADAEYTALQSGQIDINRQVPPSGLVDGQYEKDFPDRSTSRDTMTIQWAGLNPEADPKLKDVDVRRAISMAINREEIIKEIFDGLRKPATGWVSEEIEGVEPGACGEYCEYDPKKAKDLLEKAGGFDGKLTFTYNGDGGHKEWVDATCNSIKNALDIECSGKPTVDFATFLEGVGESEVKGLFRMGWQADYPSAENYLVPMFADGADSNYYAYKNPKFEKKIAEANAADTVEDARPIFNEAEAIIAEDFPTIPLWNATAQVAWSEKVSDVKVTPFGYVDLLNVKVKG